MLGIVQNGIVRVAEDGTAIIVRPGKNGGNPSAISVSPEIAERCRLATGDIVEGETEPVQYADCYDDSLEAGDAQLLPVEEDVDLQYDEPIVTGTFSKLMPTGQWALFPQNTLTDVLRINALDVSEADDRPYAKTRRSQTERTRPDRLLSLSCGPNDTFGRMLDFAAPLGCGDVGAIMCPHGCGLTTTARSVLRGITANSSDCVVIALLLQARGEEVTDFRRRFPDVDVIVCPVASFEVSRETAQLIPALVLEAAQRQTELGKDVVLVIDSLTALWGTMLEMEDAADQRTADLSQARQQIREFLQKAGCFHGETPLGGSLGGSLTIIGTVWSQPIDEDAEEDRETHPYLRLVEQIVSDVSWRVCLDPALALQHLYPAIDIKRCLSQNESVLLPPEQVDLLLTARGSLPRNNPAQCYKLLMDALDEPGDLAEVCRRLIPH